MSTQEITLLDEFLTTVKETIEEIQYAIGNWKEFENLDKKTIEEYKKEDAALKDLAGSLLNVYNQFQS